MSAPRRRPEGGVALAAALTLVGCASERTLAEGVANAARPDSLPLVVACWEKEFEAAELRAEYVVTAEFVVESGTSKIRDAKVVSIEPSRDTPPRDTKAFAACVEEALNRSALPAEVNKGGAGFSYGWDVAVRGYRFAFVDPSESRRRKASERQAHVLLGPRADRCQGLYTHDPPRDASVLYGEVDAIEARAARYKGSDPDLYARELQKAYDARLELESRLALDLADPLIPEANKKRMRKAREDIEKAAKRNGEAIGCTPPARPKP